MLNGIKILCLTYPVGITNWVMYLSVLVKLLSPSLLQCEDGTVLGGSGFLGVG